MSVKTRTYIKLIEIDLRSNSMTVFYMETGKEEIIKTYQLTEKDIASFLGDLYSRGGAAVEATGSTELLREQTASYVKRFVVVAPGKFEDIRHSINKTDRHDARALAFFLSKDILPEARSEDKVYQQLSSTVPTHDQMVKLRTSLLNQVHGILNHYGIKAKKEKPTIKKGFQTEVRERAWKPMIQVELEAIDEQIRLLLKSIKHLEKEIITFAQTLPGFKNLLSIKGIGSLSAAILLPVIGSIKDFESDKKIADYFGIIPKILQSNETCHMRRITKRRSTVGRSTLAQCTLIAKRYSQYLNTCYEKLKIKKGTSTAIIATARKFLNHIFYTLKNNWIFEDFINFEFQNGQST